MSLPNYLAKIKSAGMYRFTFDKSQLPTADAETMRLVVGYSDKGPFNNPVYIENRQDFITVFGNINKKLERKGVFFHRMALQALASGPIIALNLKPFKESAGETDTMESVDFVSFEPCDLTAGDILPGDTMTVRHLFDRNRFWKIDVDQLPYKIESLDTEANKYISIAATDALERSCSIFFRKCHDNAVKQYNISVRDWYKLLGENIPEYFEGFEDTLIKDYFAEVYVFRGEFTEAVYKGVLNKYFTTTGLLKTGCTNVFNEKVDALAALAADSNSNFIGVYRGCLLPYFKDQLGVYQSLDLVFNADRDVHKMIMKLDDTMIDDMFAAPEDTHTHDTGKHNFLNHWPTTGWDATNPDINVALKPTYIKGYEYNTLPKNAAANEIHYKSLSVLDEKGIFTALTNHVDSEYHYIIDTFSTLIDTKTNDPSDDYGTKTVMNKFKIAAVAKAKDNCLAIINAPAMNDFFKNISGFTLENLEKGEYSKASACYFKLPNDAEGGSHCAYYTPVVIGEGAVKTVVPSAALVSNNFMEKWKSRQPYFIVAGPNHGKISCDGLIGPDYNYSREDLDVFEPLGVNCIVYVPRKGTYINSNQTAKQVPVTALSKVHVRELVTYLQDEIEKMMQNYQWELNTQTLRDTIKTKADAILEKVKNNGGVYDYLNVCDGSNNTTEVIDNEMVILDTSIEPARGAGKMVQRLTIHKTGGISSLTK